MNDWEQAIDKAQDDLRTIILLLTNATEQEPTKLLRIIPFIRIMINGCEFLIANLDIVKQYLVNS